ncbi:hypothetical protein DLAC_11810 [Tieghemostelium lacteum]|uniref:Beta-lactamase class A catalytic domain-containing protein n=1 Tax=Tieghemostelium lacteum TaxID=361077 RepID=A0A151Z5I7_TIELA|nr:hypothetical protein DLAC_11810 [Tieghemostelium lacteum]|eukprot:KYQ89177.1 hypothetical protein DLAC_11810 [Tieghemostelium lacteum]
MKLLVSSILLILLYSFVFCFEFNSEFDNFKIIENSESCSEVNYTRINNYVNSLVYSYDYCEGTEWALTDFSNNKISSQTANDPQQTASTIKLWILISVFQDIENGLYTLDTIIPCSTGNITIFECMSLMIGISDNCATYSLTAQTTLSHVNQVFSQLGMPDSHFSEWCFPGCLGYENPCPNTDGTGDNNVLASNDVVHGLSQLISYQILQPNHTAMAIKLLLTAHGWEPMIGKYIPSPVAHKQGWLPADEGFQPFTENDEAIVFTECGTFGLSIMITRNWTNPQEDAIALQLGANIAKYIYCSFVPFGYANDGTYCSTLISTPIIGDQC